ncbi:MAG: hypothetical protein Q9163_005509 [Psora crenata]
MAAGQNPKISAAGQGDFRNVNEVDAEPSEKVPASALHGAGLRGYKSNMAHPARTQERKEEEEAEDIKKTESTTGNNSLSRCIFITIHSERAARPVDDSKRLYRSCKSKECPRNWAENSTRSRLALHEHQSDIQRLFIDMASNLARPSSRQRSNSRPTSASSSSIVTVHRASSHSSHNDSNPRPIITGLRTRNPNNNNTPMNSHFSKEGLPPVNHRSSPETTRTSSAAYGRPDSGQGTKDGTANKTSSHRASATTTHHRKNSFSKRLSGSIGSLAAFGNPQVPSPKAKSNKRPRSPPVPTPPTSSSISPLPGNHPALLPPIMSLSSLSQVIDAADSPSTMSAHTPATGELLSPSTHYTGEQDYFGGGWSARSPTKLAVRGKRTSSGRPSIRASPGSSPQSADRRVISRSARPTESPYSPPPSSSAKAVDRRQTPQYRNRANSAKSTGTTEGESSASDNRDLPGRPQRRRAPSQKALLSKALAKANHAVVLDGKQNVEGAILAYGDACNLLRQVMVRSPGEDDRRKLEAVVSAIPGYVMERRNTYKNRIVELRNSDQSYQSSDSKALPERPPDRDSMQTERLSIVTDDDDEDAGVQIAEAPTLGHDSGYGSVPSLKPVEAPPDIQLRRLSLHSPLYGVQGKGLESSYQIEVTEQPLHQRYNTATRIADTMVHLQPPFIEECIPPPLSPRRPLSPTPFAPKPQSNEASHSPKHYNDQHTSWLNTINESSGSSATSVHSRRSSIGMRRKRIRAASGTTEAEFDAALDAAIETAYDDGFEPDDEAEDDADGLNNAKYPSEQPDALSSIRRNIELAKENVREAEREAVISQARERERQRIQGTLDLRNSFEEDYGDDEGEEEERMLEEMTRDFVLDDIEYNVQTKSALPRQSDSSGFSGRTWGSSIGSNPTSAGTSLSTVAEVPIMPSMASQLKENPLPPPVHPPPSGALPPPPVSANLSVAPQANGSPSKPGILAVRNTSPGVRDRRLTGTKAKQLKIETDAKPYGTLEAPAMQRPASPPSLVLESMGERPKSAFSTENAALPLQSPTIKEYPINSATLPSRRKSSFPLVGSDQGDTGSSSTASALTKLTSAESDAIVSSMPSSPARFANKLNHGLRKNFSSSSLRTKGLSAGGADGQDISPNTSVSSMSSTPKMHQVPSPAVPVLPTPLEASFTPRAQPMGGIYIFDNEIHSATTPGSPNPRNSNAPLPLEPCPESTLLRPFWFLRSIYQTIAHPRGGYITTRLFVPRDIWRVKNIKLKNVEEKVSTCDLLTAALLKLGKVDTYNADAVLEEMQFLENVMEQAQANLSRKLGNEVGVQGTAAVFKGSNIVDDSASNSEAMYSTNANSNKSYLKSWRKLRSKNSLGAGYTVGSTISLSKNDLREAPTMKSLPMTAVQNPKFAKRDVSQVQCMGPNPSYMGALARLCDAAQILDQIARQVEDPGLRHSSQTHVGLELSTRHAAEFFGFYICRFVFADVGLMLDKFIKRGSEWVLA